MLLVRYFFMSLNLCIFLCGANALHGMQQSLLVNVGNLYTDKDVTCVDLTFANNEIWVHAVVAKTCDQGFFDGIVVQNGEKQVIIKPFSIDWYKANSNVLNVLPLLSQAANQNNSQQVKNNVQREDSAIKGNAPKYLNNSNSNNNSNQSYSSDEDSTDYPSHDSDDDDGIVKSPYWHPRIFKFLALPAVIVLGIILYKYAKRA